MTNEMMVAIIVDALIDKGLCEVSDFDKVGRVILGRLKRYKDRSVVSAQSFDSAQHTADLSMFYDLQYVQNERSKADAGSRLSSEFVLEKKPVAPGTLVGTIYRKVNDRDAKGKNGVAVQTFLANEDGEFVFTDVNDPKIKVLRGNVIHNTGEILLEWNEKPGVNVCVFNYEYKHRDE